MEVVISISVLPITIEISANKDLYLLNFIIFNECTN